MRIVLVTVAALLSGCSAYAPPRPLLVDGSVNVTVHWVEKSQDLQQIADSYGETAEVDGFAVVRRRASQWHCDIYTRRPRALSGKVQELLGHEFAHCLFGPYHP